MGFSLQTIWNDSHPKPKGRLGGFIFDNVAYINEVGILIMLFNEVYYNIRTSNMYYEHDYLIQLGETKIGVFV